MWNECWNSEVSKKKPCQCFLLFVFFVSCRLQHSSSLIPQHRQTKMLPRVRSKKFARACAVLPKKKKKVNFFFSQSLPPCSLPHSGNLIPTSPTVRLRFLKNSCISTGDVQTISLSSAHVKITKSLHPDNLTKSLLCAVRLCYKLSYASKRYDGLESNAGVWSVGQETICASSVATFTMYFSLLRVHLS